MHFIFNSCHNLILHLLYFYVDLGHKSTLLRFGYEYPYAAVIMKMVVKISPEMGKTHVTRQLIKPLILFSDFMESLSS